ncbi:hypothetical protein ACFVFI_36755 [Streptomyces sp. NPDC057705]|uniref:hypothetical protein n=1 Tax=Streptomyces sp. NPDC057705 TaxID=3346222 RepID=UPI00367AFFD7
MSERGVRRRRFDAAHLWVTTATGLVALGISLYNFATLQRTPEVDVHLPHLVRIEPRAPGNSVHVFLQPTISTRIRTEDVEVVTDARLELKPADPGAPTPAFYWNESGTWIYDFDANQVNYNRVADPTPLVVSQDKPQQPTILFHAQDWAIRKGRYTGSLVLQRASSGTPVTKHFCVEVSDAALKAFSQAPERAFFELRNDVPGPGKKPAASDCYAFH